MEQVSFQPFLISQKAQGLKGYMQKQGLQRVDSRLRILSEPDLYMERLAFQKKMKEAEVERQKKIREEEERKECTFVPAVHEAPAFVKRIAKSMEITRKQDLAAAGGINQKGKKGKPDWK